MVLASEIYDTEHVGLVWKTLWPLNTVADALPGPVGGWALEYPRLLVVVHGDAGTLFCFPYTKQTTLGSHF